MGGGGTLYSRPIPLPAILKIQDPVMQKFMVCDGHCLETQTINFSSECSNAELHNYKVCRHFVLASYGLLGHCTFIMEING